MKMERCIARGAGKASYDFSQINYEKTGVYDIILTYEGYTCKVPVVIAERKTEGLYTYLTDENIAELEEMIGDKKIDDEDSDYDYEFTSTTLKIPETLGGAKVVQGLPNCDFMKDLPNLKKINVMDENPYWCSIDDVLYKKEGDNKLTLYSYPAQKTDQSFTVEENVSSIASSGLYSKHLENITFKSPETEIGNWMSAVYIKNIYLDFYLSDQYDADMYLNDYYFQREYDLDDSAHFNFNIYIRNEKALACIAESLRSMVNVIYY